MTTPTSLAHTSTTPPPAPRNVDRIDLTTLRKGDLLSFRTQSSVYTLEITDAAQRRGRLRKTPHQSFLDAEIIGTVSPTALDTEQLSVGTRLLIAIPSQIPEKTATMNTSPIASITYTPATTDSE